MEKFCQYCGSKLNKEDKFCKNCGFQVCADFGGIENNCPYETMRELRAWYQYQYHTYDLPVECFFNTVSYKTNSYYVLKKDNSWLVIYLDGSNNRNMIFNGMEERIAVKEIYDSLVKQYGEDLINPVHIRENIEKYLSWESSMKAVSPTKQCPNCGEEMPQQAAYCPNCKNMAIEVPLEHLKRRVQNMNSSIGPMPESNVREIQYTKRRDMTGVKLMVTFMFVFIAIALLFVGFFSEKTVFRMEDGGNLNVEKPYRTFIEDGSYVKKKSFGEYKDLVRDRYYFTKYNHYLFYYDYNEYSNTFSWYSYIIQANGHPSWMCISNSTIQNMKIKDLDLDLCYETMTDIYKDWNFSNTVPDITKSADWREMHKEVE